MHASICVLLVWLSALNIASSLFELYHFCQCSYTSYSKTYNTVNSHVHACLHDGQTGTTCLPIWSSMVRHAVQLMDFHDPGLEFLSHLSHSAISVRCEERVKYKLLILKGVLHVHLTAHPSLFKKLCSQLLPRSMGSTKRHHLRPQGDARLGCTALGNRIARRLAYLPGPQLEQN